ncbi:hypothetical protein GCM10017744_003070 [Streptomyces antimycoticus]|uniref:Uncharacterized protein n=1 Tax=Streptomyces antimycoticus TaxID=68175 RepID=A0A4D4KIN1_9ACTN|nr:hypothetical protein SANT12839_096570 [Streptomyces antimycoticus]
MLNGSGPLGTPLSRAWSSSPVKAVYFSPGGARACLVAAAAVMTYVPSTATESATSTDPADPVVAAALAPEPM